MPHSWPQLIDVAPASDPLVEAQNMDCPTRQAEAELSCLKQRVFEKELIVNCEWHFVVPPLEACAHQDRPALPTHLDFPREAFGLWAHHLGAQSRECSKHE
jgi:hypothetical protein